MLTVGDKLPSFEMLATVANTLSDDAFTTITDQSYADQWKILFFWPKDFTFVCPTEIAEFGSLNNEFSSRNAQVLGASVDSEFVHLAWRQNNAMLKDLPFPMLADIKRELSEAMGVLDAEAGVAKRATFIIDPENVIRFVDVTDMNVGRNPQEVLRVLDALQTGGLTACNWQPGQSNLEIAA